MQKGARSGHEKLRRNWALPQATVDSIESIREQTDAGTDTEVIKRAVKLYQLAVDNEKTGMRVIFRDKDGKESAVIIL